MNPSAEIVISHLTVSLRMARHFLPRNELLAHLIMMALVEARKKPARPGRHNHVTPGVCAIPAVPSSTKHRLGANT